MTRLKPGVKKFGDTFIERLAFEIAVRVVEHGGAYLVRQWQARQMSQEEGEESRTAEDS